MKRWSTERIGFAITVVLFVFTIGGWIVDRTMFQARVENSLEQICSDNEEFKEFIIEQTELNGGMLVIMKLVTDD